MVGTLGAGAKSSQPVETVSPGVIRKGTPEHDAIVNPAPDPKAKKAVNVAPFEPLDIERQSELLEKQVPVPHVNKDESQH